MNIGMILSILCGILVVIFTFIKIKKLQSSNPHAVQIFEIWSFGLLAFLSGFLGQILGLVRTFDAISQAGDVSPSIVANGVKETLVSTLIGVLILMGSIVLWAIVNRNKKSKIYHWKD